MRGLQTRKSLLQYSQHERESMPPELIKILENVKEYCEDEAIYDKLSSYGDFYYKIVALLKKEKV